MVSGITAAIGYLIKPGTVLLVIAELPCIVIVRAAVLACKVVVCTSDLEAALGIGYGAGHYPCILTEVITVFEARHGILDPDLCPLLVKIAILTEILGVSARITCAVVDIES